MTHVKRTLVGHLAAPLLAVLLGLVAADSGAIDVSRGPAAQRQQFEAWGTSLAWWANGVGGWNDAAARSELVGAMFNQENGLALNYARYNIGGGQNRLYSGNFRPGALVQGWVPNAPSSVSDTSTWVWNWNADATQRRVLDEAMSLGVSRVDAISYSAPFWMTNSLDSAGGVGGAANLPSANYNEFAHYQAEVVEHFYDNLGVRFQAVSPLNEPNVNWWVAGGQQEGMVVPAGSAQRQIFQAVGQALEARGLPMGISLAEETNTSKTVTGYQQLDSATKAYATHLHTHVYGDQTVSNLNQIRTFGANDGLKIYQSEYGNNSSTGLLGGVALAGRITQDINEMGVHGWTYWQAVEPLSLSGAGWGLAWAGYNQSDSGHQIRKQYHVMRQFTSYIRPGSTILDTTDNNTVAAYDPVTDTTVVVATNPDAAAAAKSYSFLDGAPAFTRVIRTTDNEDYASQGRGPSGSTIAFTAPGPSVTTLVLHHRPNLASNAHLDFSNEPSGATALAGGWRAVGSGSFQAVAGPGDTTVGVGSLAANSTTATGAIWQEGIGAAATDLTGRAYQLSLDLRFKELLTSVYDAQTSIGLEFYGADGATLAHASVSDYETALEPTTDDNQSRTFRTGSVMAPAGTRYVRPVVRVEGAGAASNATVRLDNVYLQEVNYRHRGRRWLPTGGGSATTDGNWEFDASRAEHDRYFFGPTITAAATVSLTGDTIVRQMTFESSQLYRLAGAGRVVLQGAEAMIDARSGSHLIQTPMLLETDAVLQAVGDAVLTVNGAIDLDGHTLRTQGAGSIRLNGALTLDGGALEVFAKSSADVTLGAAAANLNGTLRVLLGPGESAGLGSTFELLTFTAGATNFAQVELPILSSGLEWRIDYEPARMLATVVAQLLEGDYNNDGVVDAADYSVWRDNVGAPAGTLPNDPNPGPVGAAQYATWAAGFGGQPLNAAVVPEPTGATLVFVVLAITRIKRFTRPTLGVLDAA